MTFQQCSNINELFMEGKHLGIQEFQKDSELSEGVSLILTCFSPLWMTFSTLDSLKLVDLVGFANLSTKNRCSELFCSDKSLISKTFF